MILADEVLSVIRVCGPITAQEIGQRLGLERPAVNWTIWLRLYVPGYVVRVDEWRWDVTEQGRQRFQEIFYTAPASATIAQAPMPRQAALAD